MTKTNRKQGTARRIVLFALVGVGIFMLGLAAAIAVPILTHTNTGSSGQTEPGGIVAEVRATGDDGRTRLLSAQTPDGHPADLAELHAGDHLTIVGSGFDASIGIYVSFCRIPEDPIERPSPCLGGIPEGATEGEASEIDASSPPESAWVTDNWAWRAFATHTYADAAEGEFEVTLTVPSPQSEGLDCTVSACAIFTRADHTALEERVQDMYLPIRFADSASSDG